MPLSSNPHDEDAVLLMFDVSLVHVEICGSTCIIAIPASLVSELRDKLNATPDSGPPPVVH